jgi:cysteinyl-tRNA synthetase
MSQLKIYNTKTGQKQVFVPINSNSIGIYVCGITVYDYCHIGHARTFIAFDVIVRYLKHKFGVQQVTFVRNITDIDDKIIKRAQENGESITQLTDRFIAAMNQDAENLGLLRPDREPRATEYMQQMIALTQKLISKGFAYLAENGDVYYKVRMFTSYGSLAKRDIDEVRSGSRVEINEAKTDPLDFVLWKKAKDGEPAWDSPWGSGRPGWHLECSAMAMDLLGETFDLHGGGFDLIFPHHENECAQAEAATGHDFVKTWLHVGFLQINKEKMAKSTGNFVTIKDILQQVKAEELRFFMLSGHYRSQLEYSLEQVKLTRSSLDRLYTAMSEVVVGPNTVAAKDTEFEQRFTAAMDDDFNTPEAVAVLFDLVKAINKADDAEQAASLVLLLKNLAGLLGLLQRDPKEALGIISDKADQQVNHLIAARDLARQQKNWPEADRLRAELIKLGVSLEDTAKGGTKARKS